MRFVCPLDRFRLLTLAVSANRKQKGSRLSHLFYLKIAPLSLIKSNNKGKKKEKVSYHYTK